MENTVNSNKGIVNVGQWNWQLVIAIGILFSAFTTMTYKFISSVEKQLEKKIYR